MNQKPQEKSNKINFEKLRKLAKKIRQQTQAEAVKYPQQEQSLIYGNGSQR